MRTRIVLADDHQLIIDGVQAMLASEPDFVVVGQVTDGLAVLPTVLELTPDVLVLDVMMPGLNGLEAARQVHERAPTTKILMLSMHADDAYVAEALRNGALGYVLKQNAGRGLVEALHAVCSGARYLSPPLSEEKLQRWQRAAQAAPVDRYEMLSTREREVLQLAAEGLTSKEIGGRLSIGKRTVETHRANLQRKLGLKSQADLIRLALRRGLVAVD